MGKLRPRDRRGLLRVPQRVRETAVADQSLGSEGRKTRLLTGCVALASRRSLSSQDHGGDCENVPKVPSTAPGTDRGLQNTPTE